MTGLQILVLALLLDYLIGDPPNLYRKVPHPAVLMGRVIGWFDRQMNHGSFRVAKGVLVAILISIFAIFLGWAVQKLPTFGVIELVLVVTLLAHKSLADHVRKVATALRSSLVEGQNAVSMIVGRDTASMSESDVSRAAVESAAENFSDAVVAPVLWFFVLGLPGFLFYKMINTADSMIGHKSEQYKDFGMAVARLDDVLNYIPARLTGGLICLIYRSRESFDMMLTDADLHSSPNAGWPEAAMAGVLGVSVSGPRMYGGQRVEDAYINPQGRSTLTAEDIDSAISVLKRAWFALFGFFALLAFLQWLL